MNELLAPNGKPSNLTPEQYKLVRTPEFKAWFGDWENDPANASKVVDSNGEPLVVYHGTYLYKDYYTELNNISYFTDNKITAESYPVDSYVFYETFDEYADDYGVEESDIETLKEYDYDVDKLKSGNIMVREDDWSAIWKDYDPAKLFVYECFLNLRNPQIIENADDFDITYITNSSDKRIESAKFEKYDSIIGIYPYKWFSQDKINYHRGIIGDFEKEKHFVTFNSNQIKLADGTNTTFDGNNPDIRFEMGGKPFEYTQSKVGMSRRFMPNVRGGWTKEKIIKYLKSRSSDIISTYRLVKYISEFDNWQEFKEHIFYHGTSNYIDKGLKPSITMSEREAERSGGGGYGDRYFGVSLTSRKRTAESFSGMSNGVTIYPVILKRDAVVIERTDLKDASEVEDIIIELYEKGVDAVWIGGGEEELVVINPFSILLYEKGSERHSVFGGFKSIPLTDDKIKEIYDNSFIFSEKYTEEYNQKENKEDRENYLRSLPKIQFNNGGEADENNDDDYYYDENDIFWTNEYLVHYLFSQMNQFKHLEEKNLILSNDEKIVFREYNNVGRISMKPLGLWYAKGFEWVNWVQFEMPSWSSNYHYLHEIKTTDKVLKINNQEDAIKFSVEYGVYEQNSFDITEYTHIDQIDWHKVAKKWSGIEMVNPRANFEYITDRRLLWTGSWDIASGCIWKADGFSEINLLIDYKDYNNPDIRFAGGGQSGGDCYYVAGQFVIGNVFMPKKIDFKGTPYLVQAEVQGQGKVSHLRYGHAWIEDDEYVYDFSNNRELIIPKIVYYAIGDIKTDNPKKYRKYTFNEARRKMVDTGHYGCWDIDVEYENGGDVKYENQPRDLTQIENYRNIYKGAEFYTFSESSEKQEKADRWFELFRTNQKERQLTTNEFKEFMELSNELSWEEFANGGDSNWDAERYRQVEKEMYELRNQKKGDSDEYFKLIEERAILEKNKLKKINIKNMEYGKGGKVNMLPADTQKFGRIGVTDKYIIEATKDVGLQGINFDSNSILKRISATFDSMLENYKSYLISKDSPSITNYINNEIETHKEQGSPLETIQRLEQKINNQNERNDLIKDIAKTQEETLIQWVKYLNESEYPVPFKFLMLKAVFEYNYDVKQNKLFERGEETIRNFTPFDAGSLAELYAKESDYLLMEYNVILNENANRIFNSKEIISQSGNGKWIKFNGGRKTKPEDIQKNGKELMQLVQNTYWCTKTAGTGQLMGGDFYVYVTESNGEVYPRIAVRMNENEVGEVRGNRSSAQDLDDEMLPIAEEFLIKNIPNNSGKKWLDSIKYNRRCVALKNRFETEGLFKDSIYEYMELIAGEINLNHGNNSNLSNLKQAFRNAKNKLPNEHYKNGEIEDDYNFLSPNTRYFIGDLSRSELRTYRERYNVELTDLSNWKLQLVSGYVFLQDAGVTNLGNLEFVGKSLTLSPTTTDLGKLNYVGEELQFNGSEISSLKNLETIGGGLVVTSKLQDLGKLKKIGFLRIESSDDKFTLGSLEEIENDLEILNYSVDIDFGNLKTIGGSLIAKNSQTQDLKNLESVGGDFIIAGSKIKKFENLKSIGGNADFSNNFCSSTQKIDTILGDIKFVNSRIMQFPNLIRIGGTIEFRGSLFTSFGNIKNIGGNLNLAESKLLDLGELEAVGGYISFKGSKVKSLGKLKKVTQFAHFELSEVEDLGNLEIIGGNAYFQNSKVKSLGKLNYIGGSVIQFGNNKQLQEQWEKIKNG